MKLSQIIFWIHLPVVLLLFLPFLIPLSLWPERIIYHFYYVTLVVSIQIIWGIIIYSKTKKIDVVCPLTTWMQLERGYKIKSKKNHKHSYMSELASKLKFGVSYKAMNFLILLTMIIVTIQFIWFR